MPEHRIEYHGLTIELEQDVMGVCLSARHSDGRIAFESDYFLDEEDARRARSFVKDIADGASTTAFDSDDFLDEEDARRARLFVKDMTAWHR